MVLSYGTLALFCIGVAIVWFWHDSLRARDIANTAAMAACERIGLQFLDGTAAFVQLRITRAGGPLRIRRTYVFDYTSQSIERRQGFAILAGNEVEYVGFAPEHTAQPDIVRVSPSSESSSSEARRQIIDQNIDQGADQGAHVKSNVYDLSERRAKRPTTDQPDATPKSDRLN